MKNSPIRQLPSQISPVETGPARFGNDKTGVFIRADNARAFSVALRSLLLELRERRTCSNFWKPQMENLLRLLESGDQEGQEEKRG